MHHDTVRFSCDSFLNFSFNDCRGNAKSQEDSLLNQSEVHGDIMDECLLDGNEEERGHQIFEFV